MDYGPQRVVSLQPSATSVLARLGALDRLVACTKWCRDVCPELAGHEHVIVADSWSAQSAQILAVHPDLVIAAVPYRMEAVGEILKSGIAFLGLAPRTLADVYGDIAKIAGIMGVAGRGEELIREMQVEIERVRAEVGARGARVRVHCEEWGKPLIRSQPWVAELVAAAGGEFLGAPGSQARAEEVAAQDPEVVVAAWCGAGDRVPLEKIVRERGWSQTRAASAGRVYCIRDELLNTPGPALVEGLRALAHAIRPELFAATPGIRALATAKPDAEVTGDTQRARRNLI